MDDLSKLDGNDLIEPVEPTKKTKQTRRRLSYNPKFIKLVSRLVAAGHDAADIAFIIGVKKNTIEQWKYRYPAFRRAWDNGKTLAGSYLIATGLKLCEGYEVEETTVKYINKYVAEEKWVPVEKKVVKKLVPPNAALIQFFLAKLVPDVFGKGDVEAAPTAQQSRTMDIANGIQQLAGKLTQMAGNMSEPVDVEFEDKDEIDDEAE